MARIRSIKPEFWSDPIMAQLSHSARLLYIGLWNYCDDSGRGQYIPKAIEGFVFPREDLMTPSGNIHELLSELREANRIIVYEADGEEFFHIPRWHEHQKPQHPRESKLPAPDQGEQGPHESLMRVSGDSHEDFTPVEVEVEGVVEGEGVREPKGSRRAGNERTELFEAFYQAWHQRPYDSDTKLSKSERGRINAAVKEALDLAVVAEEVLTRARRYRQEWPAIELTPQALMSNWTRFDKASEPPPPFDPASCEHPKDRRAPVDDTVYCGACGKEIV